VSSRELFRPVGAKSIHGRYENRTRTHPRLQCRARLFVPVLVLRASAAKMKTADEDEDEEIDDGRREAEGGHDTQRR
jgi:hypothetical protein